MNFSDLEQIKSRYLNELELTEEELNWRNIVKNSKKGAKNYQKLLDYGAFRKYMVDEIIEYALQEADCKGTCILSAVGSTNPTSDYDISISGPNSAKVVEIFVSTFRELFNDTSDNVFDTNLYGIAFYEPVLDDKDDNLVFSLFPYMVDSTDVKKIKYIKYIPLKDTEDVEIIKDQRVWAYIKLIKQLNNDERDYLNKMINDPLLSEAMNLITKLDQGDNVDKYVDKLKSLTQELNNLIKIAREGGNFQEQKRIYQDLISTANYYASEAYYTRGAFFHVVGHLQSKISDLPITKYEYIDSYIENTGDLIKTLKKYNKMQGKIKTAKACKEMLIDASKYYFRTIDALINYVKLTSNNFDVIQELIRLRESSLNIKSQLRGKSICNLGDLKNLKKYDSSSKSCVPRKLSKQLYVHFLNAIDIDCKNAVNDILELFIDNMNIIHNSV